MKLETGTQLKIINETKSWLFERISKISKSRARIIKLKRNARNYYIRNERAAVSVPMDIKRLRKEHYEQLYAHKFYNLGKTDQFFERHNLSIVTQEIDNLNTSVSIKETASIINNLPNRMHQAQRGSLVNFTKHLRKKLYQLSTISFRG